VQWDTGSRCVTGCWGPWSVCDARRVPVTPAPSDQSWPGVRASLAGRRMLLTGATGFVGEALLERVLSDLPETTVALLVRGKPGATARQRVEQLLAKPAFGALRERLGEDGVARVLEERIEVLDGDLSRWPALPDDLDVVVHCAGEVSFDPAIDEGFTTNALGVEGLLRALQASGSRPHVVHVSTAYVNGLRKGPVGEGRLEHAIDWRSEAAAARRMRDAVEDASRGAGRLAAFLDEARAELGREGPQAVAADAERRRVEWVRSQLVDAGRERALSLGFTDCYTFTKAMGERVAEELAADLPLSVVRPSIIESALEKPFPGWIEGYKMAEPIILAYGRAALPDFPGVPDGVVDIIPVDLVVSATLAAAALPPPAGEPRYLHLCSGGRRPLMFADLYTYVREYFREHPLEARDRGTFEVPTWAFPGTERLERRLRAGERAVDLADKALSALPRGRRVRSAALTLDRQRAQLEFLRRYLDLYRHYASAEVVYLDAGTQELERLLPEDERELFGFDPRRIDWRHYLTQVHCPSVTSLVRAITATPRAPRDRVDTDLPSTGERGGRIAAVFDMDGTLLPSNVVESYLRLRLAGLAAPHRARELGAAARALPGWLLAERRDRGAFIRDVYAQYAGASVAELDALVDAQIADDVLARVSGAAVRRVREHRAAGHLTVLVTGAIGALARPLAPLFDEVASARLAVDGDGRATGHLAEPPLVGESRATWLRALAAERGLDLEASYAYADSASDLPLLRAVGRPVAVNPDATTLRAARASRWPVRDWRSGGRPARQLQGATR
jgi:alcohol-forming fatty acyl-CoA reductase